MGPEVVQLFTCVAGQPISYNFFFCLHSLLTSKYRVLFAILNIIIPIFAALTNVFVLITIHFPPPDFRIVRENNKELIFDRYRKKYVTLTPEEWVRQNFLNYLVKNLSYPSALIGIEKEIFLGEMKKRFDIVIYNRNMQPWMLVECKEMNVPLTQQTLEQVVRYNMVIPATYLVMTNGTNTFCCTYRPEEKKWLFMKALPSYSGLG